MRIDALTLRAVAGELDAQLAGARIDPVIAPTPHAIALQCYINGQNHWLLLSAHPQLARLHLLPAKPQKLVVEPSSFVMLLRKYLEGGRITSVRASQWERVVTITCRHGVGTDVQLIAEIMGNLSNVILIDEHNQILGALHHVPPTMNRYRTILPGHLYHPPPPQTRLLHDATTPRLDPLLLTVADLRAAASSEQRETTSAPVTAWHILARHVAGAGQDLAREVVCRATGDAQTILAADAPGWDDVTRTLQSMLSNDVWEPVALLNEEGRIVDGALWPPCAVAQKQQLRPMPSVNALLAAYFAVREWHDALTSSASDIRRGLKQAHDRLQKKLIALRAELDALQDGDRLRAEGELLLVCAGDIPPGADHFDTPDFGAGMGMRTIALDAQLTAVENANLRFARYHKMRRAALQIPPQIERASVDLARIAQLQTDLDLADSLAEVAHVRREVSAARLNAAPRDDHPTKTAQRGKVAQQSKVSRQKDPKLVGGVPLKVALDAGFICYAGKNSQQNEYVTFTLASSNDIWLHARGVPGAHVIIKNGGRPVPPNTLDVAAGLAAWLSQSRGSTSVPVDYTEQRYVRHMKDGGPGMVIYSKEHTIPVAPREPANRN